MDGLGQGLHAKWNKSEKDILYHITYMWDIINIQQDSEYNNRVIKIKERGMVVSKGWKERGIGTYLIGIEFQIFRIKRVPHM